MGFTQRQAAGKFTRDEVDSFIARLQAEADGEGPAATTAATTRSFARPATRSSADEVAARRLPDQLLAAELRRRGWTVAEP
jgi:nitrogen fixation protein FixH